MSLLPPWWPWRWRQHSPLKHWYPAKSLYGITIQKTATWIFTAMKTSNFASSNSYSYPSSYSLFLLFYAFSFSFLSFFLVFLLLFLVLYLLFIPLLHLLLLIILQCPDQHNSALKVWKCHVAIPEGRRKTTKKFHCLTSLSHCAIALPNDVIRRKVKLPLCLT